MVQPCDFIPTPLVTLYIERRNGGHSFWRLGAGTPCYSEHETRNTQPPQPAPFFSQQTQNAREQCMNDVVHKDFPFFVRGWSCARGAVRMTRTDANHSALVPTDRYVRVNCPELPMRCLALPH